MINTSNLNVVFNKEKYEGERDVIVNYYKYIRRYRQKYLLLKSDQYTIRNG